MFKKCFFPAVLLFYLLLACKTNHRENRLPPDFIPADCNLLLWVQVAEPTDTIAILVAFERQAGEWKSTDTVTVSIGRNGIAAAADWQSILPLKRTKQEGDGCSPAGLFPLLFAFGYAPVVPTNMEYRTMQEDDICVDDQFSADYNQHVSRVESKNNSHEKMRRQDEQYKLGVWVGYNTDPIVPGNGSCIFLHIWKTNMAPTSGCTAMAEQDMKDLIHWLDKDAHPYLLQTSP